MLTAAGAVGDATNSVETAADAAMMRIASRAR
jgi:hypothetical protein